MPRLAGWLLATLLLWLAVAALVWNQPFPPFEVWVALPALAWQILAWLGFAAMYQAALRTVEIGSTLYGVLPLVLAALHHREIPTEQGPSTFVAEDAQDQGHSADRSAAGVLVARMAALWAFELIFVVALGLLLLHPHVRLRALVGACLLIACALAPGVVALLGMLSPSRLGPWLAAVARWMPAGWAERRLAQVTEASVSMAARPLDLGGALLAALAVHGLHLLTLEALMSACGWHGSLATLCAIQTVSVLAWLVPAVPQRAGLVDGAMVLTGCLLGIPSPVAQVAIVSYRLLSYWIPSWIGFWLAGRGPARRRRDLHWRAGELSVRLVATLTAAMGLVNMISATRLAMHARLALLSKWLPLSVHSGSRLASVLLGFILLRLSRHLWHRKRVAWILTEAALVLSALTHLTKGLDYGEAGLAVALAAWMGTLRAQFHARSDPPSVRQGLGALGTAVLFTMAYGTLGFYTLEGHYHVGYTVADAFNQTLSLLTQWDGGAGLALSGRGRAFMTTVFVVAIVSVLYSLFMLLRPVLVRQATSDEEWDKARAVVEAHGCSALAPFALLRDKTYFFSPGGSVFAYVVKGAVAVVLADPIGPAEDRAPALAAFQAHCTRNDWTPAFMQTGSDTVALYEAAGFEVVSIGTEATVDLEKFTLAGGAAKNLRSTINKVKKAGYRAEVHCPPFAPALMAEMRSISDEWLTLMHGTEKHFCLGWFDEQYLSRGPLCAVYDTDGHMVAFANILSEYQKSEATGDLMRRRRVVENGTMEFLFVSLFEWAKAQGYATFSLGLCPMAGVGEKPQDPVMERAFHHLYEHVNQFYNFKGLHAFKEKFHPSWTPRYIVYPRRSLPAVAIAMIRVTSGDTFLWDSLRDLLTPRPKPAPPPTEDPSPAQ